jgi:hypothetical protein
MALIYSNVGGGKGPDGRRPEYKGKAYDDQEATKNWATHYRNALLLSYLATDPRRSWSTRAQAREELAVAEKKMNHWMKHRNWDLEESLKEAAEAKREMAAARAKIEAAQ